MDNDCGVGETLNVGPAGAMFLLLALVVEPAPGPGGEEQNHNGVGSGSVADWVDTNALADVVLYEVTEDMYLSETPTATRDESCPGWPADRVAQLSGWAKLGARSAVRGCCGRSDGHECAVERHGSRTT